MPGTISENRTYISIVGGKIVKSVPEGTEGARRREWEAGGRTGVKHELVYDSWTGLIEDIRIIDTEFGEMCNVVFEDAILSMNTASRYFTDFAKKACSMDTRKPLRIAPFDFTDDEDRRKTGVSLYQGDKKLENKFWDAAKKKPVEGFPEPEGDKTKYKSDDWKIYYLRVKKYLVGKIGELRFQDRTERDTREVFGPKSSDAAEKTVVEDGYEDEPINLNAVPF